MRIQGLQKMTLLDFPGKVACTVFTAGCNFRCPFCHNAPLVTKIDDDADYDEGKVLDFLASRTKVLDGVAVTGGEPLLCRDIGEFLLKVKNLGYAVKLDTNGSFPDLLASLVRDKLVDYVAVDIKNSKDLYARTVGLASFDLAPVEKTVDFLLSDKVDYEFRTTVVSELHTVQSIGDAAKWIKGAKRYFLQCFKDSGNLISDGYSAPSKKTMLKMLEVAEAFVPNTSIRGVD